MGTIPKQYKKEIGDALIAETLKTALLKASTFVYDPATHVTYANVSAFECSGTGYTAAGAATTLTGAYSTNDYVLDATDVSWGPNATISDVGFAVLYRTSDGKIRDIKTISPTAAVVTGTLTLQWNASGVLKIA